MSGRMQENSDIAARLVPEETRAGGMTTPVLWRAEASIRMERMASALVTASKEAITSFAKFLTVHIIRGSIPSETSPMWKPATGEPCAGKPPARFGGRGGESLPYPYQGPQHDRLGCWRRARCCGPWIASSQGLLAMTDGAPLI